MSENQSVLSLQTILCIFFVSRKQQYSLSVALWSFPSILAATFSCTRPKTFWTTMDFSRPERRSREVIMNNSEIQRTTSQINLPSMKMLIAPGNSRQWSMGDQEHKFSLCTSFGCLFVALNAFVVSRKFTQFGTQAESADFVILCKRKPNICVIFISSA